MVELIFSNRKKWIERKYFFPGYMLDFMSLEKRLKEFPNVKFIAHGPLIWEQMKKNRNSKNYLLADDESDGISFALLKKYPNFYLDLSGMAARNFMFNNKKFTRNLFNVYWKNILFGTDTFLKGQKQFIKDMNLESYKYKAILGINAINIIGES